MFERVQLQVHVSRGVQTHKKLEGRHSAEFEMKEAITSLDCRLMETLSMIEIMKADMKALKEGVGDEGSSFFDQDREAKVEDPKPYVLRHS